MILILGAGSDIAQALAEEFTQVNTPVMLAGRHLPTLKEFARHINIKHTPHNTFDYDSDALCQAVYFDAKNIEHHQAFWDMLPQPITGVILAYGVMHDQCDAQNDYAIAQDTLETNFTSAVSILEIAAKHFEQRQSGFISVISSVAGDRGRASNYIYGASKAGLSAYTQGLSHRLAKSGVHVCLVKPGFVDTKMTAGLKLPKRLTASAHEVAHSIYHGIQRKRHVIYTKSIWRYIMHVIKCVPHKIMHSTSL